MAVQQVRGSAIRSRIAVYSVPCARSAGGLDAARADLERYGIQVLGVPADIGVAAEAGRVVDAALTRSADWTSWCATQG